VAGLQSPEIAIGLAGFQYHGIEIELTGFHSPEIVLGLAGFQSFKSGINCSLAY
jgi:hypothetical protein